MFISKCFVLRYYYTGDIVHLSVLNKNVIVVGSLQALTELFSKRSANYSNRPYSTMIYKLMDLEWIFAFQSCGMTLCLQCFQESVLHEFRPLQANAAHDVVRRIMETPNLLFQHLHMHTANSLMGVTYAMEMTARNCNIVTMTDEVIMAWSKVAVHGSYLVDALPILRFIPEWLIPGGGFKKEARECKEKAIQARNLPFDTVLAEIVQGTARPSFVSNSLTQLGSCPEIHLIKACAGTAYFAGTEAISISLSTFILAMVAYPDVQAKAQRELDDIVGKARLPNFDDQQSLPYVNAIIKEVLRWNPPAPLAIPHTSINVDHYEGYHLPAGSIVIGNLWKILHNPEVYAEPLCFNPERFMPDAEGSDLTAVLSNFEAVYGVGRRICPGRFVAVAQLFVTIASILSVFDIRPGLDEDGKPIHVEPDFTFGVASHPLPFKCSIAPRGDYVRQLLNTDD
ncbi:hypothetical protein AcV7_005406 [Taiwanofungus camphoratus]|nr:hypothetical protein AcV7_005406 [Antrodia cinnamomea]